jgi:hypothetical protein
MGLGLLEIAGDVEGSTASRFLESPFFFSPPSERLSTSVAEKCAIAPAHTRKTKMWASVIFIILKLLPQSAHRYYLSRPNLFGAQDLGQATQENQPKSLIGKGFSSARFAGWRADYCAQI